MKNIKIKTNTKKFKEVIRVQLYHYKTKKTKSFTVYNININSLYDILLRSLDERFDDKKEGIK